MGYVIAAFRDFKEVARSKELSASGLEQIRKVYEGLPGPLHIVVQENGKTLERYCPIRYQ